MDPFSLAELAAFIGITAGAASALIATLLRSRCDTISCCWGAFACHRAVNPVEEPPPVERAAAVDAPQTSV
jgi:hypothetical protein